MRKQFMVPPRRDQRKDFIVEHYFFLYLTVMERGVSLMGDLLAKITSKDKIVLHKYKSNWKSVEIPLKPYFPIEEILLRE